MTELDYKFVLITVEPSVLLYADPWVALRYVCMNLGESIIYGDRVCRCPPDKLAGFVKIWG